MRWDALIPAALATLEADATVSGIVGTAIYKLGERNLEIPSIEWDMIVETHTDEVFESALVTLTCITASEADLINLTRGVRDALDRRTWQLEDGEVKSVEWLEARRVEGPVDGILSQQLDFRLRAAREVYT
jgi:hypothetical protein